MLSNQFSEVFNVIVEEDIKNIKAKHGKTARNIEKGFGKEKRYSH